MLERKVLAAKVGPALRLMIAERAATGRLRNPIPELLWGRWDDEEKESYFIAFHEKDELPVEEPIRLVEADGLEFVSMQDWICAEIEGRTLDLVNRVLTVL